MTQQSIEGENFLASSEEVPTTRITKDKVESYCTLHNIDVSTFQESSSYDKLNVVRRDASKKAKPFMPPDISNLTDGGCADILGDIRERLNNLKKEENFYADVLKARLRTKEKDQKA